MNLRIDKARQAEQTQKDVHLTSQQVTTGSYKGRDVTLKQNASSLFKGASEYSEAPSEKKSLRDRSRPTEDDKNPKGTLKHAAFTLKDESRMRRMHLADFIAVLKRRAVISSEQVVIAARQFFMDVSNQYLALVFAHEQLQAENAKPELLQALEQAINEMEAKHGSRIQAGLNVARRALAFEKKGVGKAEELQEFYSNTVVDYEGAAKTYEAVLEHYGKEKFIHAVEFLMQGLGDDLAGKGSSVSKTELKKIMDELDSLKSLNTLHEKCAVTLERMDDVHDTPPACSPLELMQKVLTLIEDKWVSANSVDRLVQEVGASDLDSELQFLREFLSLVREVPEKLFPKEENRANLLQAVQDSLDQAIAREEEELGE